MLCFNLSILECKCHTVANSFNAYTVLIDPYWNVNINGIWIFVGLYGALIYPYWNVNSFDIAIQIAEYFVLIYPYWNVN